MGRRCLPAAVKNGEHPRSLSSTRWSSEKTPQSNIGFGPTYSHLAIFLPLCFLLYPGPFGLNLERKLSRFASGLSAETTKDES